MYNVFEFTRDRNSGLNLLVVGILKANVITNQLAMHTIYHDRQNISPHLSEFRCHQMAMSIRRIACGTLITPLDLHMYKYTDRSNSAPKILICNKTILSHQSARFDMKHFLVFYQSNLHEIPNLKD